jgi:hypothetical protein
MAQTALTKALQQIRSLHVKYDHLDNMLLNRDDAIQILTDLLPYERETIEAAFHDGNHNEDFDSQKDYFNQTYNQ